MTVATDRRQGISSSIAIKVPVRATSTADLTLSGEQTVDGVALVADDRVLVKNQTTASENGIYDVNTSTWSRSPDFDGNLDVGEGTIIPVNNGTTNSDTFWRITNTGSIVIGTTSLTFEQVIINYSGSADWIDFTPTVQQGGAVFPTFTATYAQYRVFDETAFIRMKVIFDGSTPGTAGNAIIVSGWPVAINPANSSLTTPVGEFIIADTGTTYYTGTVVAASATTMQMIGSNYGSGMGLTPSFSLTTNDVVSINCCYKIA